MDSRSWWCNCYTVMGKMWLSVLGVFDWSGTNPLLPELWDSLICSLSIQETQKFRGELVKKLSKCKESFGGDLNKVVNVCAEAQMDELTMKLNEEGKQDCSGQNDVYGQVTKEPLGKIHCYSMSETRSSVRGAIIINLKTCLKTGRGRGRSRMKPWMLSSLENYVLFKLT